VPSAFAHRSAWDVDIRSWEITALFQAQHSQARPLDGFLKDVDGPGQAEAAQAVLPGFEARKTDLDVLPGFFLFHPPEEVSVCRIQVAQGFLRRTFGHVVHLDASYIQARPVFLSAFSSRCRSIAVGTFCPALQASIFRANPQLQA